VERLRRFAPHLGHLQVDELASEVVAVRLENLQQKRSPTAGVGPIAGAQIAPPEIRKNS
jgi:hypothetical protein